MQLTSGNAVFGIGLNVSTVEGERRIPLEEKLTRDLVLACYLGARVVVDATFRDRRVATIDLARLGSSRDEFGPRFDAARESTVCRRIPASDASFRPCNRRTGVVCSDGRNREEKRKQTHSEDLGIRRQHGEFAWKVQI